MIQREVFRIALIPCLVLTCANAGAGERYRETTLDNGLRVILIEHHANPMVASSVIAPPEKFLSFLNGRFLKIAAKKSSSVARDSSARPRSSSAGPWP